MKISDNITERILNIHIWE